MMETESGPCNPARIKQEPIDDLTVVIKTEPEWETEENSSGLPENTKNAFPEMFQEEIRVYTPVKLEPMEYAFEECEGDKNGGNSDPVATCDVSVKREVTQQIVKKEELFDYPDCSSPLQVLSEEEREKHVDGDIGVKREVTQQIVKKEELFDYPDCSSPLQVLSEEEREKHPDCGSKKDVLVNIVPFIKQELDCNLHGIHERRPSSVTVDSRSGSIPVLDDCEDSDSNFPESPRLVIAETEDTSSGVATDELSERRSLLGDGWRVTVFRCGHCMALAWDVVRLARHDCSIPQQRKLNSSILGQLKQGTQVKYINAFGCRVCGKLFFKRKNYRKHVSTMHSEEMLLPFVKCKVNSEGDGCGLSLSETTKSSVNVQLTSDTCGVNSCETDPKLAHGRSETAPEDSSISDLQSSLVENSESPNVCMVCGRESCQMHKYALIRAKYDISEKMLTFTCRTCVRDFRCEDNYWRHMYYHGFKTENLLEEEPTAASQAEGHLGPKKKTRRHQKKSGSLQVEEDADASCENTLSQLPTLSLADFCSSKSGSQKEGTVGIGTSTMPAKVCFAPADACEIHNPPSMADRSASENNKRKISVVSLTTDEDEPDPKKKKCCLPAVEHSSPADNCVTVETEEPPSSSSPQQSSEALGPDSSLAGDICGSVSTSQKWEGEHAVERETFDVALDDVQSERLEKNEWSKREAVDEEEIQIITEKLSEEYNALSSTVSDNFSAMTNTEEMCSSSSLLLSKGMNQSSVEVINIDDEDEDNDKTNDNGRDDKPSSFQESDSFEIEEKCDGETKAVSGQENVEQGSDCFSYSSEQGHCQQDKTYTVLQNMEVDSSAKEGEVGSTDSTAAGEKPQHTACSVTVGGLQSVGMPFVRAGVSYGARVAVLKCVNNGNNGSHLGHENQAAVGCEGRTGVRLLQVSNTTVYHTVPIRQITMLTLVPTVKGSENSDGTVDNLRKLSELSLKVSGTPRTGACLLKCEKCNLLGAYGTAFFSHKCSPTNISVSNGNKVLSGNGLRVATNGAAGQIFSNSEGASSQTHPSGGAPASINLTGSVVWKCLRCKFATYRSDIFKLHSCESTVRDETLLDSQTAGAGMRYNAGFLPVAGMRRDTDVLPRVGMRHNVAVSPDDRTRRDVAMSPGDRTRRDVAVSSGDRTRRDVAVSSGDRTRRDVAVSSGDRTKRDADMAPCDRNRSETDGVPAPPVKYLWKCVGCSLYSNSRQCLLMHKCSSFKRKVTSSDAVFTSGPELMCCKCGFKTAGRLMFATHKCAKLELPAWWPRDKLPTKESAHSPSDSSSAKVCETSPQKSSPGSVHDSVLNFVLMHSGAKMVENNGSFLVMLPNMSTLGSPA